MAEILGKDLEQYDNSDIANAPFNLVESEIAGPRFMTGKDLSRSAKISAEWKKPIAIPTQAKGDRTVVEEISSSFLTGASDAVANMPTNARNTVAQTYLESGILGNIKRIADVGAGSTGRTIGEGLSRLLGYDVPDDKNKDKLDTYDNVIDILEGRVYPLDKYARRVIANATDSVESRKIVRELYNQAQGIDSSKLYNQGATIIGAMTPALVLTKGAYGAGRAFGASRIAATNLATNIAKGYIGAEMGGQYAEETAAQYRERTGDMNFENFTAKDAKGLSAIAYGAIGAQIEFIGGVEPIVAGALNKVGLRSGLLSAGLKIGAGEATEEFLQGITETLMRKIDNTSDKTWAEGFKEALQGAAWGAVIGGGLGTTTFYANRRNLVKGIKTALPNISEEEAKLVADAMIDSTAEMTTQNPTLRAKLREKVAMMYRDSDIDNKEQNIDAITDLEYSLITMDAAERGVELSEHELFGGIVNELGWFRKGIPENRIAEVQELNNEIKSLKDELAKENAQEEKNWDKIDELETKLAQSNQYVLDKISDLARDDAMSIRRMLRKTEAKFVKKEKEKATKKAIKSGNVDIISDYLSKAGFKMRDMSGTQVKELARLNWELLQDKDLGQSQSRGTVQRKLADIEANVENGNAVLLRAGYTQEMINKMDDETWNRAILIQYRKEMPATDENLVPDEALEDLPDDFFQSEVFSMADENTRLDDIYPEYAGETINIDGKERSVYNSNGERIAKSEQALRNFYKWFGDSKVVDEQGRPLVVYHGTNNKRGFSTFDKNKISTYRFGKGFYFSEIKRVAEIYSNLNNHETMQVYLKIENPYFISKDKTPKALKYFADKGMANKGLLSDAEWQEMLNTSYPEHALETAEGMASENKDFSEYPKSEGYDGIIYTYEQGPEKDAFAEIIAFEPNQIKSTDNRGTYSSDTGNIYWQINNTQLVSPLKRKDYDFTSDRIWLKDNEGKTHIIEPYFILWDGERVPVISLRDSLFVRNTQMYKLFEEKGGESVIPFKNIWYALIRNIEAEIRGKKIGDMPNGSYEKLQELDNKELLLNALQKTKEELIEDDIGSELKGQIGVVDTLIENFNDNTIQANFDELVSLSDGTHLVTHGIGGDPQSVKKFLQNGKVYNPSLYIAEKPSEYGYRSVVLFARPDILKRKESKIFDRDAYSTTISREPIITEKTMPNAEKLEKAADNYDKYFDLGGDSIASIGFVGMMERGLENIKDDYYFNSNDLYHEFVRKYIIVDAIERGLLNVDKTTLTGMPIPTNKLAELFETEKPLGRTETIIQAANKALDLIGKQENKTRDEVLDSYKELVPSYKKVVESTGEEATVENIAKAQRQSKKQFGRWRDIINNRNYGFTDTNAELLEARADSGILASIFTREIPFSQMVKEKGKTGRYSSELESRKRIRKYAIMSAMGNLISHGKIRAVFLPPRVKKTDVEAYMRAMRYNPDDMISRAYADETVAEIEKMAKRFAKIYKSLTKEEQDIFVSGIAQIEKHPELESKIKIKLEESGVKNDRVIDDALLLMEEVYNHPVSYFEGKVLSDVNVSDFIGAYVNSDSNWDDVASMLENQGVRVVRGEPSDVKSATIKLEEEVGEDIRFQNRPSGAAPKDYRGAYIPAYRFIQRSNRMDASTLSHELAHDWMEVNFDRFRSGEATPDFMRSWGALEKALGIEENATQVPRQASETFARAYEAWITSNPDWSKFIAVEDKDKDKVEKLLQDYQGELRNIYNDINNKYFKDTWGKLGELKPELKAWFDRVVNITDLDVLVERGELTPAQAENEKLNRAIDTVIESTTDEDATKELRKARLLNDTNRYEVEGGNQNSLQNRLSVLAREIDDNNITLKGEKYNTRRDMLQVAEAADNFVKTRLDDALAIINGEMAEVEGLYKEDIYTALERLAVETGDMNLISELKNSEIANQLAKELGQRVAGFRNWKQSNEIDVFSALKSLDNNFNKALKNKKAQKQFDSALDLLDESLQNQDKVADKQLDSMLKELECQ